MLLADHPRLERLAPDFSDSGQDSPTWTRVVVDGLELINGLEALEWPRVDRVQLIVCEDCGVPRCQSGGWAGVSRLGDFVVLAPIYPGALANAWERTEYRPPAFVRRRGSAWIPKSVWADWREHAPLLPEFKALPLTTRQALVWMWLHEAKPVRDGEPDTWNEATATIESNVLAADTASVAQVLKRVGRVVAWAAAAPDIAVDATPRRASTSATVYFDGPHEDDWRAFCGDEFERLLVGNFDLGVDVT